MTAPKGPDGDQLLVRLVAFFRRFIVFANEHQAIALAIWVMHTHAFDAADSTPYPLITSPEKRSGKSRLQEVLALLVARGWHVAGVSEAVLFRKIEKDCPALLLDEIDAIFGTNSDKTEPIRALINSGNRRGGTVARCVGKAHEVADFSVFCPKCFAGIDNGTLPETIRDRSIPIRMRRKLNEKVERFRFRLVKAETADLAAEIGAWASENLAALEGLYPELPDELNDRASESWEPLLAIAELIGDEWPKKAAVAAVALCAETEIEDDSFGVQLLSDLKQIWDIDKLGSTLPSSEICGHLHDLEGGPWKAWGKNRKTSGLDPRDLARFLRRYGIKPKTVRIGDVTRKGYKFDQLADAWGRYVPEPERDGDAEVGGDA